MRRKEAELEEMTRRKEAESQRVRELETQLRQLRDLLHDKDQKIRVRGGYITDRLEAKESVVVLRI